MDRKIEQLYESSLKDINTLQPINWTKLQVELTLAKWNKLNGCLSVYKLWKKIKNIIIRASSKDDFLNKIENFYKLEEANEWNMRKKELFSRVRASSDNEE